MVGEINVIDLISFLGDELIDVCGDPRGVQIDGIVKTGSVGKRKLDWVNSSRLNKQQLAEKSLSTAVIVDGSVEMSTIMLDSNKVLLRVRSPRNAVGMIGNHFFVEKLSSFIHTTAVIDARASLPSSVFIGPNTVLGNCVLGERVVIHDKVTIADDVEIGNDVHIYSGAVLGTNGLGCYRNRMGSLQVFPHLGKLIIMDDVVIGANCSISRGSLSDTIIEEGTKINALCFIAHNCLIGKNVLITGSSMLNGSVQVGDNATIFSQVIIRDQARIGNNSIVGMGSVVTKDVPPNEVWIGNPARFLKKNDR